MSLTDKNVDNLPMRMSNNSMMTTVALPGSVVGGPVY